MTDEGVATAIETEVPAENDPFKALLPIEGKNFHNILKSHSNCLLLNSIFRCLIIHGKEVPTKIQMVY